MSKKVTQKKKGFEELARAAGLKEKTLDILAEHDFDSVDTIRLMSETDLQEVGVSRGQKAVLKQWQISMEPKKKAKGASLHSDPVCADKPSTSTADVTITEDEVTSLMSAVAGISMADGTKDTMDKHSKFLVTPTCSDKSIIKVPRPFEYVDKDFKRPGDITTFAELILGAVIIMENAMIQGNTMDDAISMSRHVSFIAQKSSQRYTTESLILYDDAVRDKVQREGGTWPTQSDTDLCNRHLRQSTSTFKSGERNSSTPKVYKQATQSTQCFRYNSASGCMAKGCKLSHTCLICNEEHAIEVCTHKRDKK